MSNTSFIYSLWKALYPEVPVSRLDELLQKISPGDKIIENGSDNDTWYKDAVVYSLYIDLFNKDIPGLVDKLDYLQDLGVSCLWLLPVLESPMRDAGFDIADYYRIREDLAGDQQPDSLSSFRNLLKEAHARNIRVIFDVAVNHTSDQHNWFQQASSSAENPYRDYYIWTKDTSLYNKARIIFKGIEASNWERMGNSDYYYFHRFFSFQPDLNYRNPEVILAMAEILLFWQQEKVDGFRLDAIPYLWKEEGTDCENLPNTHLVVKFFRAILDYSKPGSLLLAEACQPPLNVVEYLGQGDECHAAFHFPLMPRIFLAMAQQNGTVIQQTLSPLFTPLIPESAQWFTFLRCHDELSLERVYVTEEERAYIHGQYCLEPAWDFRKGEGISARLADLFQQNPDRILLAFSIMLTLPGTPVIYYGDEIAKGNDDAYYEEMIRLSGKDDTRFLVRGKIDWTATERQLSESTSLASLVYNGLRRMLQVRSQYPVFGHGSVEFPEPSGKNPPAIFAYIRKSRQSEILVLHNLSELSSELILPKGIEEQTDLLHSRSLTCIEPFGTRWVKLSG